MISEQVMEYHLQAIDELSIPDENSLDSVEHMDAVTSAITSNAVAYNSNLFLSLFLLWFCRHVRECRRILVKI